MKLLIFRVDRHKKGKSARYGSRFENKDYTFGKRDTYSTKQKLSFERVLFFTFIFAFTLLIVVQTALMSPSVGTFINKADEFEGTPLGIEEYLYKEGEIGLKLLKGDLNGDLKVLVNGDETAAFNNSILNIKVREGDIVELDGSNLKNEAEVVIITKSENISAECANKRLKIKSGVKKLTKITIE